MVVSHTVIDRNKLGAQSRGNRRIVDESRQSKFTSNCMSVDQVRPLDSEIGQISSTLIFIRFD